MASCWLGARRYWPALVVLAGFGFDGLANAGFIVPGSGDRERLGYFSQCARGRDCLPDSRELPLIPRAPRRPWTLSSRRAPPSLRSK